MADTITTDTFDTEVLGSEVRAAHRRAHTAAAGADGALIVDYPPEEAETLVSLLDARGLAVRRERIRPCTGSGGMPFQPAWPSTGCSSSASAAAGSR